ncbi:piRNA biogenesis protein EXD1 [Strongylocentrotus purpuratus]|uniref:3'-5' exonuclease domain-containing protein n=1 Tax=Strongylocentrotus purpuratus TaxID=7668 RepID=A0A7M7NGT1_STRPU|nr:piRNA biogenesis protein EXD1 [Strongylocentrotus purpuratus]
MFDVLAVPSLFTRKFIDILQATNITKVIHDCRFVSDLLYHHYGIELNSVFDTQVGDILIKRRQYMGDFPRNVSGTTQCILEYLEISIHDIALHLENTQRIEEDESSWFQRPLSKVNIRCALLDTVYLLRLREAITEQLMAEVTCGIDIYLTIERDRLEVDPKKLSSRASYVPRELINDLHRRVTQMGMSSTRVKPKELSFPPPSLANPGQEQGQPPPKGPSGRGISLDASRGFQKTSPGRSAKPSNHEPPRPPLMMGVTQTEEEEESNEEVSSVSSDDSDEAFADSTEKELWQQRYSKNIKSVTLKEALTAKEESDDMLPGYQGATGSILDHQRLIHQQPKSCTAKHTVPSRTVPDSTSVSGPNWMNETDKPTHKFSTEHSLRLTQGRFRSADMTDHSYSQGPGSVAPPKLSDLQQGSAVSKRLTNMQHPDAPQRHPSHDQGTVSGQASYADALSGKKKEEEEELKVKAKRTLKAIGKALAAGENFSEDVEEDKDDGASRVDPHNGFDGYSSYGQGYSGFNCRNKNVSEKASSDQGSVRATSGRGRASLFNQQSQVLNARQSQLQNRAPGGLGMRRHTGFRTVQVDFPTEEEIESAPDSVPIAVGSSFLSQRAI